MKKCMESLSFKGYWCIEEADKHESLEQVVPKEEKEEELNTESTK